MKKLSIFILAMLMPLLVSAQKYPTGITPYTLNQVFSYSMNYQDASAEAVLRKLGYVKVGKYPVSDFYNIIYARGCTVRVGSDGFVKSATPKPGQAYASYIQVGPSIGLDWFLTLHFLSSKGTSAFISLLQQSGYKREIEGEFDEYDWCRRSTGDYFGQTGNKFTMRG